MRNFTVLEEALGRSKFRSSFKLDTKDLEYVDRLGLEKIELHARDLVTRRLAAAEPANDGKQTPFKGHPVFKAQHATGICCRGCLSKWHRIPKHRPLAAGEIDRVVAVIMWWIRSKTKLPQK